MLAASPPAITEKHFYPRFLLSSSILSECTRAEIKLVVKRFVKGFLQVRIDVSTEHRNYSLNRSIFIAFTGKLTVKTKNYSLPGCILF